MNTRTGFTVALSAALRRVAEEQVDSKKKWLEQAARDTELFNLAFELIGDARDPRMLPFLEQCLTTDFRIPNKATSSGKQAALNALTRYFDDSAADLILKVAGSTPDAELRSECFKALETIRKYQEEKGRWKDQRSSAEAWGESVRQLVVMLDDKEPAVRAQALRGLATLNALNEMARVVRMLKDPDAQVRKAAEQALSQLNAPK
jgi:HEAT repeat protein